MESTKPGYLFLHDVIQNNRKRPEKYRHFIRIPSFLYDELISHCIVDPESFYVNHAAFFEFTNYFVTISFITYTHVEDLHVMILNYLVVKATGSNPVSRGGHSKL